MDGKDVERLIAAAEYCKSQIKCAACKLDVRTDCFDIADSILLVKDYYESLLASERAKVIAELKDWMMENEDYNSVYGAIVNTGFLEMKLDSMEPDKGEQ